MEASLPASLVTQVEQAYRELENRYGSDCSWAVRSSATAEDLPDASFAGQQETFLNVSGLDAILQAITGVYASLYNDRAIAYRVHQGFEHELVAISAGVQKMVRSDLASSGVMFTLDTESGFRDVVLITGSWGLGEMVVQGAVNPDEFLVSKPLLAAGRPAIIRRTVGSKAIRMTYANTGDSPVQTEPTPAEMKARFCLTDHEIASLAHSAVAIERHYGRPMDIEWAKDGQDGSLYIVQARPETVQSRVTSVIERYRLQQRGDVLAEGRSIGSRIGQGVARVIADASQMERVEPGDVLITDMTDPDWEPVLKRAAAIVTDRGGRTCHAAIIARELGVPAVVGCGDASAQVEDGREVTVSCADGDAGHVYAGLLPFEHTRTTVEEMPEIPVKVMMNLGNPEQALALAQMPGAGVGLARLEFIINNTIGIHPRALLEPERLDPEEQAEIARRTGAYPSPVDFYVSKIVEGVSSIAAAFWPKPVIVRLSDFKSNEYANLLGGRHFEPNEENPMLGFRGAARYISRDFRPCFDLECRAMRHVRDDMGLTNLELMIPFVRTLEEARGAIAALHDNGLERGSNGLRLIMMCEIPSNVLLARKFLAHFDGFSIGSNDLTQLTLGIDRDSALVAGSFDERNPAVRKLLKRVIKACRREHKYIGICGQGPSDHPDFAAWLMQQGIASLSLNPDTVVDTWLELAGSRKTKNKRRNKKAKSGGRRTK
jgi:pyruvate,water dikinase